MVQKDNYTEYQEVTSDLLHSKGVQNRCNLSAKSGAELFERGQVQVLTIPERLVLYVDNKVNVVYLASLIKPVIAITSKVSGVISVLCLIGYGAYQLAVIIGNAISRFFSFLVDSGILMYLGIGLFVLTICACAAYVSSQVKGAVSFTDWDHLNTDAPVAPKKSSSVNITHIHNYNINNE